MKPEEIETQSFAIIDAEAGDHTFAPAAWSVVRRMIHTSADFEYVTSTRLHPHFLDAGIRAIRSGGTIVTDTNMCRAGIRRSLLDPFGAEVVCAIGAPEVAARAEREGITRARAAVDVTAPLMADGICVIGNAPTALLRLLELMAAGRAAPALVIGLPVGFVNAAESKAALMETDFPHITNVGRKGGSTVAAAAVNALAILAHKES